MPLLTLRRFEIRVLKDQAGNDSRQAPASGAAVVACRQGAIVSAAISFDEQDTKVVQVYHAGRLQVGDSVQPGADDSRQFNVSAVGETTITLQNLIPDTIALAVGDRLVATADPVEVFTDPLATDSAGTVIYTDSDGWAAFYCTESRFDCLVTGTGLDPKIHYDMEGGWGRSEPAAINAKDYPSIQAAIDALPEVGGTVFIPAGLYELDDTLYTPCDRPCHLVGESTDDDPDHGTVLQWSDNLGMLRVRGDYSSVRNLVLKNTANGPAAAEKSAYGIAICRRNVEDAHPHPGTSTEDSENEKGGSKPLIRVVVEDVTIINAIGWAIYIPGFGQQAFESETPPSPPNEEDRVADQTLAFWIDLKRVRAEKSWSYGLCFIGKGCTTIYFENCSFLHQGYLEAQTVSFYAYLAQCDGVVFDRCTFEGLSQQNTPWVKLYGTINPSFDRCWFENDAPDDPITPSYFIYLTNRSQGASVTFCRFSRAIRSKGLLKLLKVDPDGYVSGLTVVGPTASSGDLTFDTEESPDVYVDDDQIDLGGNNNTDCAVVGSAVYIDSGPDPDVIRPIQISNAPRLSTLVGRHLHTLPGVTDVDVNAALDGLSETPDTFLPQKNGNLVMNWDLAGDNTAIGALMCRWGGAEPGWRLANNLPTITEEQRNNREDAWVQGDMVLNVEGEDPVLQIRVGDVWKSVVLT